MAISGGEDAPGRFFEPGRPVVVARAPARLDVLGGIADYSGATVLELPLDRSVRVVAQATDDGLLVARSDRTDGLRATVVEARVPRTVVDDGPTADAPQRLRAALEANDAHWAAYVLGPLAVLHATGLLSAGGRNGVRLFVRSDVPAGAGVSSSAALEVATLRALAALWDLNLDPLGLALLAQQAEHRVAGAPCGIMDQAAATLGQAGHLLMLRCQASGGQPATVMGQRRLPAGVRVLGLDSGVAHRVAGSQYGRVRTAAFMGRAIITAHDPTEPAGGYLCNLAPARFLARYAPLLPEELGGAAFLARYGETGDDATRVAPDAVYHVRDCATHPVLEQANVAAFLDALDTYERDGDPAALVEAGAAMYRSHESYGARCGLGTPETDLIVDLVRELGPAHGLYGAKITGGGAGGTVAILGAGPGVEAAVEDVRAEYARRSGRQAMALAGSSDGAWASPVRRALVDENGGLHDC
jgi:galactokinase